MMKRAAFLLFAYLLLLPSARGQNGDTTQSRELFSQFSNGTILRYIMGPILHSDSGHRTFIAFSNDTLDAFPNHFLKSIPFRIDAEDTIWLMRWLCFDESSLQGSTAAAAQAMSTMDSALSYWRAAYAGKEFTLDTSLFSATSTVSYILEIRRASDNAVLWSADTVRCYKNSAGNLRYANFPSSFERKFIVPPITCAGGTCYLAVRTVLGLPAGVSLSYSGVTGFQNSSEINLKRESYSDYLEGYPALKRAVGVSEPVQVKLILGTINVREVSDNGIEISTNSTSTGDLTIEIVDLVGKKVFSSQEGVTPGTNKFYISTANILHGSYIIRIFSTTSTVSAKFQF